MGDRERLGLAGVPCTFRIWLWLKITIGGAVSAGFGNHVSTYQGNPFWYRFFEPLPVFFLGGALFHGSGQEGFGRLLYS